MLGRALPPAWRKKSRGITPRIGSKLGVRVFVGEEIHPAFVPGPVFPPAGNLLASFGQKHDIIARCHWRITVRIVVEAAGFVRAGK